MNVCWDKGTRRGRGTNRSLEPSVVMVLVGLKVVMMLNCNTSVTHFHKQYRQGLVSVLESWKDSSDIAVLGYDHRLVNHG